LKSQTGSPMNLDGRHIAAGMRARWEANSQNSRVVRAAVAAESLDAVLGGDFYGLKAIDQNSVGMLLLDGEGHGVSGSLNMLPLMSTFEAVGPSCSATHVIGQLATTAKAVGTRATALYVIVSDIARKKWLTLASAGHHSLIWFRRDDIGRWTYTFLPTSTGAMLGHPLDEPLMDERHEVSSGDLLVAYSDGVAERGESFGENQVCHFLMTLLCDEKNDPQEIANAVLVESRVRQGCLRDDATVCVVQIL
jgi:serine phosphatase RsbU (regulator of sigma subunit)